MNEVFTIEREFLFKEGIYEITGISIEHDYDINGSKVEGDFIVSGDYRIHEISINKEDFSFKIPFIHEIKSNINLDSINVEITDFKYEHSNEDELSVVIEYLITGEQSLIEFADEKTLDEFLNNNNVEVINLTDEEERNENLFKETSTPEILEIPNFTPEKSEIELKEETKNMTEPKVDNNVILNSINSEETYVKYHIHTVLTTDTLEGILNKYDISINELKKYNNIESLEVNMKLIIPEYEES